MSFQAGLGRLLTYAHAGAVLAAAADLDIELRKAIESKMRPLNSDLKSRLFDGYRGGRLRRDSVSPSISGASAG
jgi:hypothetical protein